MSEQQNRDVLVRFFGTFERQDLDAVAELFYDDCVEEYPGRKKGSEASRTRERSAREVN